MAPVAPLPFWPIDGLEFDPALHLERVLSVFGCNSSCPFFAPPQDRDYVLSVFSNARDPRTGIQRSPGFPDVHPMCARTDAWLYREHDHPVDSDLISRYPRFHSYPFLFSRSITVAGFVETNGFVDDEVWKISRLYVADIHLRWSEIVHGVYDLSYTPSRYPPDAYPFNRSYFRNICQQFRPLLVTSRPIRGDLPLRHVATGLPVSRGSYRDLMQLAINLDLDHPPLRSSEPEWYLTRIPTAEFVSQVQQQTGFWWHDLDIVVRHIRLLAIGSWLDEQCRRHAHSSSELRNAILGADMVLSDWEHDAQDDVWGWWMSPEHL